jgi:predicted enzyme related to lactoylglutathione lyase
MGSLSERSYGMAGKMVHFEIAASDADRATAFYSGLFGWEFGDSGMEGIDYRMTRTGEDQGGAVYPSDEAGGGLKIYFDTDDIDATLAKVRESGGEAEEKQPVPHMGWFAACKDTEGNAFSVWQSDESAPGPG